jgi:TonB-linked SusC/RagA family outer membrane protein
MKKSLPLKRVIPWAKGLLLLLVLTLLETSAFAQGRTITGTVTDKLTNETLPGASVLIQGTTRGASTDINGKYSLEVTSSDKVLEVSFIGYTKVEVAIGAQNVIDVQLSLAQTTLDAVVVVGYGTTKVKDLTSAITTVKAADLVKTPSSQPMQGLQGKVAGLQVVANGGPGNSSTVRIRGIGYFPGVSNESPLYVVDGMFFDNIDFLNPSDITSISVLKDASALAIFGVKAASGVVLIETKSGNYDQKTEISYEGYGGYQYAQNVVKMANAEQFTTMAMESGSSADITSIDLAMQRYGRSRVNPNVPNVNTDWYNEILRPAQIQNHSLNVGGGGSKAKYSIGANYFSQQGILDMKNEYQRFNLRAKVDIKASKWLTVGGNVVLSNATKYSEQAGAWNQAYFAVPILPVYDPLNTVATPIDFANAKDIGYRDSQNPFPALTYNTDRMRINKTLANFYMEFYLIPKALTFKSSYNHSYTSLEQRVVGLPYDIGQGVANLTSDVSKAFSTYSDHIWDNVLTYTKEIDKHNFTLMAGTSYRDDGYQMVKAQGEDFPIDPEQSWYITQSGVIPVGGVGDGGYRQYGFSYFGRIAYNYDNKYLLYATYRADGSSKYQEKWGYFPSIGAGWVLSEEKFLKNNSTVSYLKLRGSWGQLGNNYVQATTGAMTSDVVKWPFGGVIYNGTISNSTFSSLKWEVTEETNIGVTARFLKDKLTADVDYFIRNTKDAVIPVSVPGTRDVIIKNAGEIRNSGFELSLSWADQISDKLSYSIGGNISTLKNEVMDLYGQPYIDGGSAEFRQRSIVGEPLMAFFGREIVGVYQNQAEIDADSVAIINGLVPGDLKYKDQNGDGKIDDDDRVVLGSYFPSLTYGINLGLTYGNFDLSVNMYGQNGNKVLNRKRGEVIWTPGLNMDADLADNRWHGEGTSDFYPSSAGLRKGWNQKMSDFFVEDGSFFRIQNVQVGYKIKDTKLLGPKFPETKITFTADRPLTVFKYHGFSPEVANGIDSQTYPVPSTYTVGLNVKF